MAKIRDIIRQKVNERGASMENSIAWAILAYALFDYFFLETQESKDKANAIVVILSPFILAFAVYVTYKY